MNYTIESEEAFVKSLHEFRPVRAEALEQEYYFTHSDGGNHRLCNQLYHEILQRLGENNKWLMLEFMERYADCHNPNPDYFYNKGFQDCFMFLRMIHFVAGKDISLEKILEHDEMDRFMERPEPEHFYEDLDDL